MKNNQLEKKYGLPVAITMVMGIVIGIGIFFKAEAILKASSLNPRVAILAWILGGIITILAGLTVSEIGAAIPKTGGIVVYIREIYGEFAGYLTGWMHVVLYLPGLLAVVAYYTGFFATIFLGIKSTPEHIAMIAVPALLLTLVINLFFPKSGGIMQTVITIIKVIPLLGILVAGFMNGTNINPIAVNHVTEAPFSIGLVLTALVPVMFAYDGWPLVCGIGGEVKEPNKNIPRAIIFGLGLIVLFYVLLNLALLKTLPADLLASKGTSGAAEMLFGAFGSKLIFGGIVISAYGTLNGLMLAGIRFPYTLAIDGHFPKKEVFGKVSDKFNTPVNSGLLIGGIGFIYLIAPFFTGMTIDVFSDIPVAVMWAFYSLVFVGVIILRKKQPNLERPYLVPLYPIIPILATIGGVGITISAMINTPKYILFSVVVIAIGIPFYKKKGN